MRQGLPDPETVSSSIQQMWALTEIMQASQNAASIGRFDVSIINNQHLAALHLVQNQHCFLFQF